MNQALLRVVRQTKPLYTAVRSIRDRYSYAKGRYRRSYSQHGEDDFILNYFERKQAGFYVDIGASHPFRLSNTYLLYQHGWRGVTVEPIPLLGHLHKRWRPQDSLVQKAIGPVPGSLTFQEMLPSVLSTLDADTAQVYVNEGKAQLLRSYPIDVITLGQLFTNHVGPRTIDLLSIDMEGLDAETIMSFDFGTIRPVVICVEFNSTDNRSKVLTYLNQRDYRLVTDLGCNLLVEDALRVGRNESTAGVSSAA
jgi:FkbM family methyltransferase